MSQATPITSRENPLLRELRKLAHDNAAYRKVGRFWVEGDHLCSAALQRGLQPQVAVFTEDFWPLAPPAYAQAARKSVVVPAALFRELSALESPAGVGFVLELPHDLALQPTASTVVLDRVQDAGNVGSILRSAGAFGFKQIIALTGTAALWSPKVLRAGMGAHFGMTLVEGAAIDDVAALGLPIVGTHLRDAQWLHATTLPHPLAWVFGHEGQGMSEAVSAACTLRVRIAQPGGEESLNVAAAAAMCLYESARQHVPA